MTAPILKQLEEQLAALPQDALKHSIESGDVEMADWAHCLSAGDRKELSAALSTWLEKASIANAKGSLQLRSFQNAARHAVAGAPG